MIDIEHLNPDQLDAVQETGNIGCSHAATAVSQMIGKPVDISVPHLRIVKTVELEETLADMFGGEEKIVGVYLELTNEFQGSILFVFPYGSALSLSDVLMGREPGSSSELDEMARSALMEVGNIVVSAYTNALGALIDTPIMLSPPSFACDIPRNVLSNVYSSLGDTKHALIFDIKFSGDNIFDSYFILLPSPRSLDILLSKLVPFVDESTKEYAESLTST